MTRHTLLGIFLLMLFSTVAAAESVSFVSPSFTVNENAGSVNIGVRLQGSDSLCVHSGPCIRVRYRVSDGSAREGVDYEAVSGTLEWSEEGEQTFSIPIIDNFLVDGNRSFTVIVDECWQSSTIYSAGTISTNMIPCPFFPPRSPVAAPVTIINDDVAGEAVLDSANYTISEIGGDLTVTVSRVGGVGNDVTVVLSSTNGSAVAGEDYTAINTTLSWKAGESGPKTVTIPILPDQLQEGAETFNLALSDPTGGLVLGNPNRALVTITDVFNPGDIKLDTANVTVSENAGTVTLTATRANGSDGAVSVDFTTRDGSAQAGLDYSATRGTLTWASGEMGPKSLTIPILTDALRENDETFNLTLSNPTGGVALVEPREAVITITDVFNPGAVSFEPVSYLVNEDSGAVILSVTRSPGAANTPRAANGGVSVSFATQDGSAVAGRHYAAVSGTLEWAGDEFGSKTFSVPIVNTPEVDPTRAFTVTLTSNTPGLALGAATATVTINDVTPQASQGEIQFSAASFTTTAGQRIVLTVMRGGEGRGPASVEFATADGSGRAGVDYVAQSGLLTWADGDTAPKTITIETLASADSGEGSKTFRVDLFNPSGAGLGALQSASLQITQVAAFQRREGLTPNQRAVASALDSACANASGELKARCEELRGASETELKSALDVLKPEQVAAQGTAAVEFGTLQLDLIRGRIVSLRQASNSCVSLLGFNLNIDGQSVPVGQVTQFAQNALADNVSAAGDELCGGAGDGTRSKLGFFLSGQINIGNKKASAFERGFGIQTKGVTLGVDYQFTDQLVMGVAAGYGNVGAEYDRRLGKMDTHSGNFATYGSYFLPKDFYIDWALNYAINRYRMDRKIQFGAVDSSATSKVLGDQYGFSVGVGRNFYLDRFFVGPYAQVQFMETHVDAYDERGGAGLALSFAEQAIRSLNTRVGGQINYAWSLPWAILSPGIRFEWVHQFNDDVREIHARFLDAQPGTGFFSIRTDNPDRDFFNLGGSLSATFPGGQAVYFRYETRLGHRDISNHTLELGVKIPF